MDFDTEVVVLRVSGGDRSRRFAHAEADFEDLWRDVGAAAEQRVEIERRGDVGHTDLRHHVLVVAQLRVRHTTLAQNEAADMAMRVGSRLTGPADGINLRCLRFVLRHLDISHKIPTIGPSPCFHRGAILACSAGVAGYRAWGEQDAN